MSAGEGSTFGKYFLLKKIASGGMGEIFLAKLRGPVGFEKLLCVKRILAQHVENQEFLDMFYAEARIAAQLSHNNVVQIYEMGETDDSYFIVMEYVHGKSLRDVIDRARSRGETIPPQHVVEIVTRLCLGLSYAHNARDMSGAALGIVHRDINPQNLLVSYAGDVKIIDFGIAKSEMSGHKTETGTIKGKFVYMSPEQSSAEPLDKRSDQFAVGILLYEALTGINPFAKSNVILSLEAIQKKEPPPLSEYGPHLVPFGPIIERALQKQPKDRYADLKEMATELQEIMLAGSVDVLLQPLNEYMNDLFEENIAEEKRLIVQSEQSNTVTQSKGVPRPGSGSKKVRSPSAMAQAQLDADAAADAEDRASELLEEAEAARSRVPFFALLSAIVVVTVVSAAVVIRYAQSRSAATGSMFREITMPAPPPVASTVVAPAVGSPTPEVNPVTAPGPAAPPPLLKPIEADPPKQADDDRRRERAKAKQRERDEPPAATSKPPAAAAGPGSLQVSTVPPVQVTVGGATIGQNVRLKGATGQIVFGSGQDATTNPFKVTVTYAVANGTISYTLESEPWAIVKGKGGIGLGKTPVGPLEAESSMVFDFANPKEGRTMRLNLRYSP
jgi:serine/threonine protein kinase